jgi:hypothetical protein
MGQPSLELVSGDWHAFLQPPRASRRLLRSGCCSRLTSSICICSCGASVVTTGSSAPSAAACAALEARLRASPRRVNRPLTGGIPSRASRCGSPRPKGRRPAAPAVRPSREPIGPSVGNAPPVCHLVSAIVRPNTSHRAIRSRRDVARVGARPRAVAARLVVDVATHRDAWVRVSRPGESAPGGRDELVG